MTCPSRYDLLITNADGESHGLMCDWTKGGAGLKIEKPTDLRGTAVSTKGDYGVRDANDYMRIIQTDWVNGCGQKTFDRDVDSESAFDDSRSIDISTGGQFKLGPAITTKADADQLPSVIAKGIGSTGAIWASFTDAATAANRIAYSYDGDTWTVLSGTGPAASPTKFCTDGDLLYAVCGGIVNTVTTADAATFSANASNADITHIAFASGFLYATKGTATTTAQLGYFSSASPPVWTALSPAVTKAINADGATFGLVAKDSYVYWGITNNTVTKVYKAQRIADGSDILTPVATFPTGFVGACMYEYLGTVYVGGHFDAETTTTGLGAIYAITDDTPSLLTNVGTDKTLDNRVLAMSAYERSLYFVANSKIWRWDLVNGGYSHWAGPLNSTPTMLYSDITWDGTWDCNSAPGTGAEPDATVSESGSGDTSARVKDSSYIEVQLEDTGNVWRRYRTTDAITDMDDDVGTTVELRPYVAAASSSEEWLYSAATVRHPVGVVICIIGSSVMGLVEIEKAGGLDTSATVRVRDGGQRSSSSLVSSGSVEMSGLDSMVFRVTLKNTTMKVYFNSTLVCSGTISTASGDPKNVYLQAYTDDALATDSFVNIDQFRWTSEGAFAPGDSNETAVTGVQLACWRDKVVAACTGVGVVYTSTTRYRTTEPTDEIAPYLRSSRSSGNMPTVRKYFHAINATTENAVPAGVTLSVSGTIDGQTFTTSKDDDLSTETMLVFPLGMTGRNIQYQINAAAPPQGKTFTLTGLDNGDTIIIGGMTFTAHTDTTTAADLEFAIDGTDAEDATELAAVINDDDYGLTTATATASSNVVTVTLDAYDSDGLTASLGTASAAECHIQPVGVVATPAISEIAVLFLPIPTQSSLYSYYLRVWDNVQDNLTGNSKWDEDPEDVCDFLEASANTIVTVDRASGASYTGKVEEIEYIEAPPTTKPSGRSGLYRVDIRRLS